MPAHSRRLKLINFTIGAIEFNCQVRSWTLDPGIEDGDTVFTFCPDGAVVEDADPTPTLDLTFYADWRSDGISDFLWVHSGENAAFQLDHHPDIPEEHVRWTGALKLKAPPAGGDARATETTEIELAIVGDPVYTRVVAP